MKPDPYKQKKSRRYQLTHKNKVSNKNDNSNEKEKSIENNDTNNLNKVEKPRPKPSYNRRANRTFVDEETGKSYARRKIIDNSYRYDEPTYEEQLEAEADIDVAVEDALSLINSQDNNANYDPSSYFHFKKENWLNNEEFSEKEEKMQEIFKLDFNKLNDSLNNISIWDRIKINKEFIIDNNDNGYVNESKKVNKILPTYNYIHNNSISLNNNFNFNINTEHNISLNNNEEKEKLNEIKNTNENNNVNDIDNIKDNKPDKSNVGTSLKPNNNKKKNNNNIDFDIDELLNVTKPAIAKKETELEDELDMLLSLESDKTKNNTKINSDNTAELNNNFNNLSNSATISNNKANNTNNPQNMDNLQDWLDDLLS